MFFDSASNQKFGLKSTASLSGAMAWVPEHVSHDEPNYRLEFAQSTNLRQFRDCGSAEQQQVVRCMHALNFSALNAPLGQPVPTQAWHFAQSVAKGMFGDGDFDEGETRHSSVRFPRPVNGRSRFHSVSVGTGGGIGVRTVDIPWTVWERNVRTHIVFETKNQTDGLVMVRNVPETAVAEYPNRPRVRSPAPSRSRSPRR
jgi:hypothetical protein